eukprot:scaffold1050_cov51-Attheya_sp.AAC.2
MATTGSTSTKSSAPTARPVHPAIYKTFSPSGAEYSTWARLTTDPIPNLVTAHGSSLRIYRVVGTGSSSSSSSSSDVSHTGSSDTATATATATARHNTRLVLVSSYDDLAGSICSLSTIPSNSKSNNDGNNTSSMAHSWGSVTPLEQDVMVAVSSSNSNISSSSSNHNSTTVAAILGGGVAVATFSVVLTGDHSWMQASEPYIVPLSSLSQHLSTPTSGSTASSTTARGKAAGGAASLFSHGFGEILACAFWEGTTEPTLAVLHTLPGGASWPGRYGGVRRPISLTTISISLQAQRSVVLGQTPNLPDDSFQLHPCGGGSSRNGNGNGNSSGMLVVAVNSIHYVTRSNTQRITTSLAVNGWAPATFVSPTNINPNSKTSGNSSSSSTCRGNPHPLPKLSIQLNGSQWTFLMPRIALVASTTGKLYTFEVHSLSSSSSLSSPSSSSSTTTKVALSLAPLGRHVGAVGEIASLAALPLASSPSFLTSKDDDDTNKTTEKRMTLLAGLVFAGSRMGDSTLLAYVMKEGVPLLSPLSLKRKHITKGDEDKDDNDENQDKQDARIVKTKHESSSIQGGTSAKSDPDAALSTNDESPSSSIPEDTIHATVVESFSPTSEVAAQTRDAYETKLQQEEEELYGPNVVPPSSDDDTDASANESPEWLVGGPRDNRAVLDKMSMVVELEALDSLTTLGPLGPGCDGPIVSSSSSSIANKSSSLIGVRERIFPCGYGSSGGLAIVSCPGRDVESIVAEADCLNMHNIFALRGNSKNGNNNSSNNRILLGKEGGGMLLLGVASSTDDNADNGITNTELTEIDLDAYCGNPNETMMEDDDEDPSFGNPKDVLTKMTLLGASELFDGKYLVLLVQQPQNQKQTAIVILTEEENDNDNDNRLYVKFVHPFIASETDASLLSATPMLLHQTNDDSSTLSTTALSYACTWSNGHGTVVSISPPPSLEESDDEEWNVVEYIFGSTKGETSPDGEEELDEEELYYKSDKIVSMDVFQYSGKLFSKPQDTNNSGISAPADSATPPEVPTSSSHPPQINGDTESDETEEGSDFDEEEMELYGSSSRSQTTATQNEEEISSQVASSHATLGMPPSRLSTLGQDHNDEDGSTAFVAVCRQSGSLEIYPLAALLESASKSTASTTPPIFVANGCGHGVSLLSTDAVDSKNPRFHKVHAAEIRFFACGPSEVSETSTIPPSKSSTSSPLSGLRSLCLAVETSLGDAHLYTAVTMKDDDDLTGKKVGFTRVPLSGLTLTRQSKEQNRHHGKLKRKGILGASTTHISLFRPNRLHPFHSISGQDGLFAALARPLWFVSERGAPTGLWHRARHAAPAGGKARPVTGFCSGSFFKKVRPSSICFLNNGIAERSDGNGNMPNGLVFI